MFPLSPLTAAAGFGVHAASTSAQATPITDPETVKGIVDKFRAKYGANVDRYYPKRDVALEVPLA